MQVLDERISGKTNLLGLLGRPIERSLSPLIHNTSAKLLGLDYSYVPLASRSTDIEQSHLVTLAHLGFMGLNITVPFKEAVANLLPENALKSVNTLKWCEKRNRWLAYSTDGEGFLLGLEQIVSTSIIKKAIILGNGGAALACYDALAKCSHISSIVILRRNLSRDVQFANSKNISLHFADFDPVSFAAELTKNPRETLVVQASSAPMQGNNLKHFAQQLVRETAAVVDITYGYETDLLKRAEQLGIAHQNGVAMLVGQALAAQKIWWGKSADFKMIYSAVRTSVDTSIKK